MDSRAQTAQTDYNDIFGDNPQEIAKIGRQLKTKHDKLKKIVNNKPDAPAASAAAISTIISDDNSQCSADDCVSIFLGATACTAPKFYIFTEANMCVYCSVQCAAQRKHQTILMCSSYLQLPHLTHI